MERFSSPQSLQKRMLLEKSEGHRLAIVPTMGCLHEGHLSLIKLAKKKADKVILSIFVNPSQFGPKEDYSRYPRQLKKDFQLARNEKVDFVFTPTADDIYPKNFQTSVKISQISQGLCGESRPGHFEGVATIVLKLFQISQADIGIFGLKDFQQFQVIQTMSRDLNLPIKIIGAPIHREKDGLAMSSRNLYLSDTERQSALSLSKNLKMIRKEIKSQKLSSLLQKAKRNILKEAHTKIDYIQAYDIKSWKVTKTYQKGKTLVALAVFVGKTRLIDNILI